MPTPPDATEVDPDGHRIAFENEHVRILEVRNDTGSELPMHSHRPRVVVAIGPYRMKSVDTEKRVRLVEMHREGVVERRAPTVTVGLATDQLHAFGVERQREHGRERFVTGSKPRQAEHEHLVRHRTQGREHAGAAHDETFVCFANDTQV